MNALMFHDVYEVSPKETGFTNPSALIYKIPQSDFLSFIGYYYDYRESNLLANDTVWTFDDGGQSFLWIAQQLSKKKLVGHFFITTAMIGHKGFLTETDIQEIDRLGHIIGSHSHTHPSNISKLAEEEIYEEFKKSIDILSSIIRKPINEVSIPNGYYTPKMVEIIKKLGCNVIYVSEPTSKVRTIQGIKIVGRFDLRSDLPIERYKDFLTNKSFLKRKKLIRWKVMKLVKYILGKNFDKVINSTFARK